MNDQPIAPGNPTPGDAPLAPGRVQFSNVSAQTETPEPERAGDGDARQDAGDAPASEVNSGQNEPDTRAWPPHGDAVLTVDEARLYLYDRHDVFIKERFCQKLVSEYKKLNGRRVPKDGGGMELQITQSSLDEYARTNPQKKNAKDVQLDPADKLFDDFRRIAQSKPYKYSVVGAALETPATPAPAQPEPEPAPTPAPEKKAAVEPDAQSQESAARASVPQAIYDQLQAYTNRLEKRVETLEETTGKLYETLDSTYDKMIEQNAKILELSAKAIENNEKPSTVIKNLVDAVRAARGEDAPQRIASMPSQHRDHEDDETERWRRQSGVDR